jgi:hypothetical protein
VSPSNPVVVEGDIKPPRVKTKVEAVYPKMAKQAGITGEILLEVHTSHGGNVLSTKVLNRASLIIIGALSTSSNPALPLLQGLYNWQTIK